MLHYLIGAARIGTVVAAGAIAATLVPSAASASHATTPTTWTYPTAIDAAHIRTMPTRDSKVVATLGDAGTEVTVKCKVTDTVGHTWYATTESAEGYIAGRNLDIPHRRKAPVPLCP